MKERERILEQCERYWRATRVPDGVVDEMLVELSAHLTEAERAERPLASVVATDVAAFAEQWALVPREPRASDPDWRTAVARRNLTRIGRTPANLCYASRCSA